MDQELKTIEQIRAAVINASLHFGPKLLVAILLIIFGILIGKWLGRITDRGLKHFHLEPPARSLLVRIASALVVGSGGVGSAIAAGLLALAFVRWWPE